jgi:hypothetical protein
MRPHIYNTSSIAVHQLKVQVRKTHIADSVVASPSSLATHDPHILRNIMKQLSPRLPSSTGARSGADVAVIFDFLWPQNQEIEKMNKSTGI